MKLLAILCVVAIAAVCSLPREKVELLRNEIENKGNGYYRYSFRQSDGIQQEQQGALRNAGTENESYAVKGSYSWVGPDGTKYTVNYVADENGFQPDLHEGLEISYDSGLIGTGYRAFVPGYSLSFYAGTLGK